jgi:phage terminase large subunit-like protein
MTSFVPALSTKSPDRMDSLVWGATELMLSGGGMPWVASA